MNPMNDERFFDLAMKAVAQQATAAEQAELDGLLAGRPELRTELEQLRSTARLAKEALPLVSATEATAGELPGYARGRLQTKVRETYGAAQTAQKEETKEAFGSWRWLLGLATATAVLALIAFPSLAPKPRVSVQVAMLDLAGTTRGADTNEVALLRQVWQDAPFESFSQAAKLEDWEKTWPQISKNTVAKIIYDRSAGEVRVIGRHNGQPFQKVFVVEKDLPGTLRAAAEFVKERVRR